MVNCGECSRLANWSLLWCQWGLCALCRGIQISMEAILACHPVRSTEWLDCHPKSCELWRIRTGPHLTLFSKFPSFLLFFWWTYLTQVGVPNIDCLKFGGAFCKLNYESVSSHNITVRVTDSGIPPQSQTFTLTIILNDINDKPRNLDLSNSEVSVERPKIKRK